MKAGGMAVRSRVAMMVAVAIVLLAGGRAVRAQETLAGGGWAGAAYRAWRRFVAFGAGWGNKRNIVREGGETHTHTHRKMIEFQRQRCVAAAVCYYR